MIAVAVGLCFALALAVAAGRKQYARVPDGLAWLPALLVLGAVAVVPAGDSVRHPWLPELGLQLVLRTDGLGRLFALIIASIGVLIHAYAAGYFSGKPDRERLLALLLFFEGAMLGIAFSGDLITLFAFWELTSVSSFLLIGFASGSAEARRSAQQALTITAAGGLALLAGILLLGRIGGSFDLEVLASRADLIARHPSAGWAVALILAGCFTKSAQFPFHFWLPGAMAAPTPVSAYLHSATMVKAGVFLAARLTPVLGSAPYWSESLVGFGAATVVVGGIAALLQTDLKLILAYSTVQALGSLMLLLGVGTPNALHAALALLCAHALYKGALFTVAGCVDKQAGTREIARLGGLARSMPVSALAAALAGLSLIGAVAFAGFTGKELAFKSILESPETRWLVVVMLLSALSGGGVAILVGYEVFWGRPAEQAGEVREDKPTLLAAPVVLAVAGLALPLLSGLWERGLIEPALRSVSSGQPDKPVQLWYGVDLVLGLSLASWASAVVVYSRHADLVRWGRTQRALPGGARLYAGLWAGLLLFARLLTGLFQNGRLRWYALSTSVTVATLAILQVAVAPGMPRIGGTGLRFFEALPLVAVMVAAVLAAASGNSLAAVASLGIVGWGLAAVYVDLGAPDLALTQLVVEALTVVLFVFVLRRLPQPKPKRDAWRLPHAAFAGVVGCLMAFLAFAVTQTQPHGKVANWHALRSVPDGQGRNVVNVILVDFRALDTLGEITVLAVSAVGVAAMYRSKLRKEAGR